MNRSILKLLIVLLTFHGFIFLKAQAPNKINYQGIARNTDGTPLANKPLALRLSIIDGSPAGSVVYSEVHSQTTNAFGLYSIGIGTGSVASGSMTTINWASGDKFLKIEMDPNGGNAFVEMGTSQLLSVPLALYANSANTANTATSATNAVNATNATTATTANALAPSATINQSQISGTGAATGQVLKWDGSKWTPKNDSLGIGGSGDNWGTQTVSTDASLTGNGTSSNPLKLAQQGANSGQSLKWNGTTWLPSNDNVFDGDSSATNEIQTISRSNDTVFLTNGGFVKLPASGGVQTISRINGTVNLSNGGGFINLPDSSSTNELQTISLVNDTLKLNQGGGNVSMVNANRFSWTKAGTAIIKPTQSDDQYITGKLGVGNFSGANPSANLHVFGTGIFGVNNRVAANSSLAIGYGDTVTGDYSIALGTSHILSATQSIVIGNSDTLTSNSSLVVGTQNKTTGQTSIVSGYRNKSYGAEASVFGAYNEVPSWVSTSFVAGEGNKPKVSYESMFGTYSTDYTQTYTNTDRLFNIGNGANATTRSDALTLLKNGNLGLGTSTPNSKLHLQGNGIIKQNIVSFDSIASLSISSQDNETNGIELTRNNGNATQSLRWRISKYGNEGAGNNGSHFLIQRFEDNGGDFGGGNTPFSIARNNGWVTMYDAQILDTLHTGSVNVTNAVNLQNANLYMKVNSYTASASMQIQSYCAILTGSMASQTLTLPTTPATGRLATIVNHSTQSWTINPSFTIGSSTTSNVLNSGTTLQLIFDGTVWRKMN